MHEDAKELSPEEKLWALKEYLSGKGITYVIDHSNNNALVFETFDVAHEQHPDAKPIFHIGQGYQYTSKAFKKKSYDAGMIQSVPLHRQRSNGSVLGNVENQKRIIKRHFLPVRN